MKQITVGQLTPGDAGKRVVVLHDGHTHEGLLTALNLWTNQYNGTVHVNLEIVTEDQLARIKLEKLPLDFVLQVDREEDEDL